MDEAYIGKKHRPKNQRDKRKSQDKQVEPTIPAGVNVNSNPQPQRANRRQRNEISTPAKSVPNEAPLVPSEKKESTENIVIDFSNLKRETEEIAKLTKKFTKREITSNWHRYSASESNKNVHEEEEEAAAADFSDLIQVSASRGSHLQLKDEQEWSAASGEELGGYFALNLKLLSQSLACVPLYEQFRLPKLMFTEGELKRYDDLANQAKKSYNPDKIIEEFNTQRQAKPAAPENAFDILDVQGTTQKLINLDTDNRSDIGSDKLNNIGQANLINLDLKHAPVTEENVSTNTLFSFKSENNNRIENEFYNLKTDNQQDSKHSLKNKNEKTITDIKNDTSSKESANKNKDAETSCEKQNIPPSHNESKINYDNDIINSTLLNQNNNKIARENMSKETNIDSKVVSNDLIVNSVNVIESKEECSKKDNKILVQKISEEQINENALNKFVQSKESPAQLNPCENTIKENVLTAENATVQESKEKRSQSNRKTSTKNVNETQLQNKGKTLLDDEDDLDFLLSLKKPLQSETKEKDKTNAIRVDSSSIPGSTTTAHTSSVSKKKTSELDDWLDSVLQD